MELRETDQQGMAAKVEEGFAMLVLTAKGHITCMISVVRLEERCDPRTRSVGRTFTSKRSVSQPEGGVVRGTTRAAIGERVAKANVARVKESMVGRREK